MMNEVQPSRLHVVDNNECILLEFVNDSNSVAVGFLSWMKENDVEQVQMLITEKKEVQVMWPDCPIQSASYMKAKLPKANFEAHVARVLDVGGESRFIHTHIIVYC